MVHVSLEDNCSASFRRQALRPGYPVGQKAIWWRIRSTNVVSSKCAVGPGRWSATLMSAAWTGSSTRSSTDSSLNGKPAPAEFLHKRLDITQVVTPKGRRMSRQSRNVLFCAGSRRTAIHAKACHSLHQDRVTSRPAVKASLRRKGRRP